MDKKVNKRIVNIWENARIAVVLGLVVAVSAAGRTWTSIDGRKTNAELKSYVVGSGMVTLERRDGRTFSVDKNQLSEADHAYLEEYARKLDEMAEKAELENQKAGTVVTYTTPGKHALSYYCYYPKSYTHGNKLPMLILFSPGGKGKNIIHHFKPAGDQHGMLIVGCDGFRNNMDEEVGGERFKEMLPDIEKNLPHDPQGLYMGGFSGGAWRAYHYSAQFDRPWKGIIACGGWLGGKEYEGTEYRRKMAVAIVNGNEDNAANGWVERDRAELEGRRCRIKVFHFDGGHVAPPSGVLTDAIKWVVENREKS